MTKSFTSCMKTYLKYITRSYLYLRKVTSKCGTIVEYHLITLTYHNRVLHLIKEMLINNNSPAFSNFSASNFDQRILLRWAYRKWICETVEVCLFQKYVWSLSGSSFSRYLVLKGELWYDWHRWILTGIRHLCRLRQLSNLSSTPFIYHVSTTLG